MKKHITTNVDQNTVDFRRSTRNTTVNKLSKSRKRPKVVNDDVISSNETDIFGLQARLSLHDLIIHNIDIYNNHRF
jgi:hypothetical protein